MDIDVAVRISDQVCSSVQAVVVAMNIVEACKLHRLPRAYIVANSGSVAAVVHVVGFSTIDGTSAGVEAASSFTRKSKSASDPLRACEVR